MSSERQHHLRRYTFKLYPTRAQEAALRSQSVMMAQLWNALLQRSEDCFRRTRGQRGVVHGPGVSRPGFNDMCKEITLLRAECPEWQAISVTAARGVAKRLNLAFKAFFSRAKKGAGAQSGYPRYKRTRDGMSICFIECAGEGWNIWRSSEQGKSGGWRVRLKGVRGNIVARGRLPVVPLDWRTGEIIFRDGAWWLSAVVACDGLRPHGHEQIRISFNLIDEFARVERVDGGAPAASKEGITLHLRGDSAEPGAVTPQMEGDENQELSDADYFAGAVTPQMEGDENLLATVGPAGLGAVTPQMERDDIRRSEAEPCIGGAVTPQMHCAASLCDRADMIKSERDQRRRKFSYRWRKDTRRAARLQAKAARIRKYELHRWSYDIVAMADDITVIMPRIKEHTKSPRGSEHEWGASVEVVSDLNRNVLNQAPSLALQMLKYKSEQAGISCIDIVDEEPEISIGPRMVDAGRKLRRTARKVRKEMSNVQ